MPWCLISTKCNLTHPKRDRKFRPICLHGLNLAAHDSGGCTSIYHGSASGACRIVLTSQYGHQPIFLPMP